MVITSSAANPVEMTEQTSQMVTQEQPCNIAWTGNREDQAWRRSCGSLLASQHQNEQCAGSGKPIEQSGKEGQQAQERLMSEPGKAGANVYKE